VELGAPPSATRNVCRVIDGVVECAASIRLIRDNVVVHEGKLCSSSAFLTGRCMRWIKRIVFVFFVLIAVVSGSIGFVSWRDERSKQAYFNARPIVKSLRESKSRNGPDSAPAKDAFLRRFPIGSDMGDVLGSLAVEGFQCLLTSRLEAAASQVRCSLQENPDLTIVIFPMVWTLYLGFDKANKLEQVRVDQIPIAL
jgi:hypothetical protein